MPRRNSLDFGLTLESLISLSFGPLEV